MTSPIKVLVTRDWFRSAVAGVLAFLAYGGWAFWVNMHHSVEMGVRAGLLQGTYSLLLTFSSTLLMERLYARLQHLAAAVWLSMLAMAVVLWTVPWIIHLLAGTPSILMTVLPGFFIGCVYSLIYLLSLRKLRG